jgi:LysR substrate binding domain
MVDLVQEGFDLAITPPPDSTLVSRRLAAGRLVLCCAPAYLEKHPAPRCPADLAAYNCLRYAYLPFGDNWPFRDAGGNPVVARVSGNLVTTDRETLRAAAIAGIGLWLAPPYMIFDLLASGALVRLLPDHQAPELEIVAPYPHRRHMAAKVRAFIDMLVDEFANEQRWPGPNVPDRRRSCYFERVGARRVEQPVARNGALALSHDERFCDQPEKAIDRVRRCDFRAGCDGGGCLQANAKRAGDHRQEPQDVADASPGRNRGSPWLVVTQFPAWHA